MKSEADYKRWMVDSVKEVGGYARRIEDQFAVGTLDLVFVLRGVVTFAEVKLRKGPSFSPTPRQHIEMQRIVAAGGNAILIGCHPDVISFSPPTEMAMITDPTVAHYAMDFGPFHLMLRYYMESKYVRKP